MSKKLSAISLGVIVLVGAFLSLTVFKDGGTSQTEKSVKKQSNEPIISEIIQNQSDEDIDNGSQISENSEEENLTLDSNDKFANVEKASPKESGHPNKSDVTNEVDSESITNEKVIINEPVEETKADKQEETSTDVIEESTTRQPVAAKDSRRTPTVKKEIERTGEKPMANPQPQQPSTPTPVAPDTSSANESQSNGYYLSDVEQLILQKVNSERANAGLSPLSNNATMQKYARIKSADMGDRGYFAHESPDGELITFAMQQGGVSYQAWGENIAYIGGVSGAETLATQFMTNWMNSSGHRANILSTDYDSIGIGVYQMGDTVYATQEFMR